MCIFNIQTKIYIQLPPLLTPFLKKQTKQHMNLVQIIAISHHSFNVKRNSKFSLINFTHFESLFIYIFWKVLFNFLIDPPKENHSKLPNESQPNKTHYKLNIKNIIRIKMYCCSFFIIILVLLLKIANNI